MQRMEIPIQQNDFAYENVISGCLKEVIRFSGRYDSTHNLQTTNASASYSLLLLPFSGLDKENKHVQRLFKDGRHADVIESVDNYLFRSFSSLAKALNVPLQDGTEIPKVVTRLKETRFIDERTSIQILDALLILDGLVSQVNQGESLSEQDLILLTGSLKVFSKINIVISERATPPVYNENWGSTDYYGISQVSVNSSWYSGYYYNTFSTSSNTLTQSSILVFI